MWNTKVPAFPTLDPNSPTKISRLLSFSQYGGAPGNSSTNPPAGGDYAAPYYFADDTDRALTLDCVRYGTCAGADGLLVHVPENAIPADGTDQHMTIIEGNRIVDIHRAVYYTGGTIPQSGTWPVGAAAVFYMDGSGFTADTRPGATAANYSKHAGVVRGVELEAQRVPHSIFGVLKCANGSAPPVTRLATQCSSVGVPMDGPALGDWIYLDITDSEFNALTYASGAPIQPGIRTIIQAWREYGVRFGDTGGTWGASGLESPKTYTSMGAPSPAHELAVREGWTAYNQERLIRWRDLPLWVWDRFRVIDSCETVGTC